MEATGGPQTDRERYVTQALNDLVAAVGPLVEEATYRAGGPRSALAK